MKVKLLIKIQREKNYSDWFFISLNFANPIHFFSPNILLLPSSNKISDVTLLVGNLTKVRGSGGPRIG